jgi:hypothetical protein
LKQTVVPVGVEIAAGVCSIKEPEDKRKSKIIQMRQEKNDKDEMKGEISFGLCREYYFYRDDQRSI